MLAYLKALIVRDGESVAIHALGLFDTILARLIAAESKLQAEIDVETAALVAKRNILTQTQTAKQNIATLVGK